MTHWKYSKLPKNELRKIRNALYERKERAIRLAKGSTAKRIPRMKGFLIKMALRHDKEIQEINEFINH